MIIKELTLHNFGIYAGDNTFRFEDQKPIVLIGGMNGRGKTTFLEAVLIALYGPASFAFLESKSPSYSQYLRSYVNEADGSLESFIRLEFQVDGKDGDIFTITRSWNKKGERSKEKISVSRNGTFNPFLTENWGMFIEELLPSGLSNFFFFDGEKIAELAASNTSEEMKESIKNLLGISALYTLNNDLSRISTKLIHTKNSFNAAELRQIKKEKEELELALSEVDKQSSDLFRKIEHATKQIEKLKQDFTSQGGDLIPKRQSMALEASQLGVEIGNHHDQLVDYASAELPLGLVKDLLADIEKQAMKEKESRSMQDTVDTLAVMMQNYSSSSADDSKAVQEFIEYVQAQSDESMVPTVFELSDKTLFQIQHIIPSVVENTESVVTSTAQELKKKQLRLNEIQNYLDLDINEDYLQNLLAKIRSKELGLSELQAKQNALEQQRANINGQLRHAAADYKRKNEEYVESLEAADDQERMVKYAGMASDLTNKFIVKLQSRKVDQLAETMTTCYKQLANKKNLIETIQMDPATLDLSYWDAYGKQVSKTSLSAGEKQLMVVALLWALAICSKKKLPVIIDTPLSRLDSDHRKALITTYFPNASEQTIILSTDTEIDAFYYGLMKENIGDEFTLEYHDDIKATTIRPGYFLGEGYDR